MLGVEINWNRYDHLIVILDNYIKEILIFTPGILIFQVLAFCIIGIGLVFSICFHIFTPELHHSKTKGNVHSEIFIENVKKMDWLDWLKEPQYYLVGFTFEKSTKHFEYTLKINWGSNL